MYPSVRGILNDSDGGYGVDGAVRAYEIQEGVQHILLVITSSLYNGALFGCSRSTVRIRFNPPSDLAENYDNIFLQLAEFTTLLIG